MKDTLYDLYKRKHDCTYPSILLLIQSEAGEDAPTTPEAVANLLQRGTDKSRYLRALSRAFDLDLNTVEAAAHESMRQHKAKKQMQAA